MQRRWQCLTKLVVPLGSDNSYFEQMQTEVQLFIGAEIRNSLFQVELLKLQFSQHRQKLTKLSQITFYFPLK